MIGSRQSRPRSEPRSRRRKVDGGQSLAATDVLVSLPVAGNPSAHVRRQRRGKRGQMRLAASVYGSLVLEDILRNCRGMLEERLAVGRLTLVQQRASEITVTLYSVEADPEAPLVGPKIVPLEDSRLRTSLAEQRQLAAVFGESSRQDGAERAYLLGPDDLAAAYLPLNWQGKRKGVLVVGLAVAREFSPAEHRFVRHLATHLALAVENSDTHYMERRHGRQLEIVSEIAKQAVLVEDVGEFLRRTAELLRRGFDYDRVQMWRLGSKQEPLQLVGHASKGGKAAPPAAAPPMVEECLRLEKMLHNNNLLGEDGKGQARGSHLVVPLRVRGNLLGVLSFESNRLDAFPPEDLNTMEGLASLVASAFENLRQFQHAQQSNEYMQAILQSAKDAAIISTDLHGYVITVSIGAQQIFHMPRQQIVGKDILTLFSNSRFQEELSAFVSDPVSSLLERSRLYHTTNAGQAYLDVAIQRVYNSDNDPVGFLCLVRDITETVLLHQRLEALSITDDLTGLFNQRRFFSALASEIERSRRFNRTFSLCFFDLDGLKQYNDSRGHVRGDQALRETATLIRSLVRASVDMCFRYGGDEFTIMMPETTCGEARIVTERILSHLSQHFSGQITASVGIAEFSPTTDAEQLIEKADLAMYRAKGQGGNRIFLAD